MISLRLALNEIWNCKPGALCLFGICCNSFTRMWLGCMGICVCVCVNLLRSFVCENYNAALHDWLRSCHTAGRDCFNDFLGNTGFRLVEVGNLLCSRVVLLLLLCSAKGCRWIVEQPEGSSLSNHPRFQELLGYVRVAQLNCYGL